MAIVGFRLPDGINEMTRLTSSVSAAGTTLSVRNTEGFSANDYIVIGDAGNEQSEIVKITTVDSNTQLTVGAVNFSHDKDDSISFIPYNQIAFYSATTETGAKTKQGANVTISPDDLVIEVNLASVTSGFVFSRFYNSTTGGWSGYSSAVPVAGFAENSLRYIIDMARLRTQELTEDLVTDDDLLKVAQEATDEIETVRKNWSFAQKSTGFDLTAAVQTYAQPTDLAGYESIASLYLGYDGTELNYVDLKDFRYKMRSYPKAVTTSQIVSGAITILVDDTSAFSTSGTLAMSGDISIPYTGKTTKSFTGVTGVTNTFTSNAEVFASSDLDQPADYTVWDNNILIYPVPDKFYRANIDYYEEVPRMTNVSVETVVKMPSLYIWYIIAVVYRIRGKLTRADYFERKFDRMLTLMKKKDRHKQQLKMLPARHYLNKAQINSDLVLEERIHGN